MIHRAPFGSLERLIGILIEEYAGDFPLWLAPEQLRLLCVSDEFLDYARGVVAKMQAVGLRAKIDTSGERLAKMIRNGEKQKIPVMAIVGAKEVEGNTLSLRSRASGDLGTMSVEEAIAKLTTCDRNKEKL
jgi:threonyl-tRNA synthetase